MLFSNSSFVRILCFTYVYILFNMGPVQYNLGFRNSSRNLYSINMSSDPYVVSIVWNEVRWYCGIGLFSFMCMLCR